MKNQVPEGQVKLIRVEAGQETGSEVEGETYKIKTKREQTGSLGPQHIVNKKVRKTTKKPNT